MFFVQPRRALAFIAALITCAPIANAVPISATFSGILSAEPVDAYYEMFYGTPDFRFDGASYEITINGDSDTAPNYTTSYRGASQQYDFSRFDVMVDMTISHPTETLSIENQATQLTFYNFLNASPWGDLISINQSVQDSAGNNLNFGIRQLSQAPTSIIWDTDGIIMSLATLTDPGFDPNGIVRGFLRDSSDANAEYLTGPLNAGPAPVVATAPLPAGLVLLLTGAGVVGAMRRRSPR